MFRLFKNLLQIVLEILCDSFVQVNALVSTHIVRLARIHEEIGLSAYRNARLEEAIAVLWQYHWVVQTCN